MTLACVSCGRPCTRDAHTETWRDEFHTPVASRDSSMLIDASATVDAPAVHPRPALTLEQRRERNRVKASEWRRLHRV